MFRLVLALVALAVSAAFLAPGPPANAETFIFQTDMYGSQEAPPVRTQAYGFVRFFFNDDRSAADYTVDVKGLATGLVLGADIHRGAPGENGPVIKKLAGGHFIVTAGRLRLSDDDLAEMADGKWYVSLKSVDHPDGAMRGQIVLPQGFLPRPIERTTPPPPAPVEESPQPDAPQAPIEEHPQPESNDNASDGTISPPDGFDANDTTSHPPPVNPAPAPEPEAPAPPSGPVVVRPPNTGDAGLR